MQLPHSPACERNREPILAVLRTHFAHCRQVFEVGSGTGEHVVHCARAMPWLSWQASDRLDNVATIGARIDAAGLPNTPPPVTFDVNIKPWPTGHFDALFSANTLHIMAWAEVERMFAALDGLLAEDATVVIYGPFNEDGAFTSASNAAFDASLKARDPHMGIRDVAAVDRLAYANGLRLVEHVPMPANNRCLIWRRASD